MISIIKCIMAMRISISENIEIKSQAIRRVLFLQFNCTGSWGHKFK